MWSSSVFLVSVSDDVTRRQLRVRGRAGARKMQCELQELEECYLRLEQQRFKWPAQKFSECAKELEAKIKQAELRQEQRRKTVSASGMDGRNQGHLVSVARVKTNWKDSRGSKVDAIRHWIVERDEVLVTEEAVDKGGWGDVKVAEFRGTKVCAKYPHQAVWSDHHSELFVEEMSLAARIHHPNIVLFMAACLDKQEVFMLTELLPTTLRQQFEWKGHHLSHEHRISIGLDVARALNYLHLMKPDPIIHRDINSANVLLSPTPYEGWRAKIADHCCIHFKQQYRPTSSEVFITPETGCSRSLSPKMDIFGFGILLVEMYTAIIPEASSYERLIASIHDQNWVRLIEECICKNRESRPSAADIISKLNHWHILSNKVLYTQMIV